MKIRHIFIKVAIIALVLHLASGALIGSQIQSGTSNVDLQQMISSPDIHNAALGADNQFMQNESIFSKATLISLLVAVMGVVAFRRNI